MAHKGLSTEKIVHAAAELIEQQGRNNFSMRLLADNLGIKTASLYNHVKGMDSLLTDVCHYALQIQMNSVIQVIESKHRDEAVRIVASTYRTFAKDHRELYWLTMDLSASKQCVLEDAADSLTEPLKRMLSDFNLPEGQRIHFRRLFRSIVHGFIFQEAEGFFSHNPVPVEESFDFAIHCYIRNLNEAEKEQVNNE